MWRLSVQFFFLNDPATKVIRVIIDPGHGGINPRDTHGVIKSDRWDDLTQQYRSYFGEGMQAGHYREAEVVFPLALRVSQILNWTQHPIGWYRFRRLLAAVSPQQSFPRVLFHSRLTRKEGVTPDRFAHFSFWQSGNLPAKKQNASINDEYRIYDYRDMRGRLAPGRLSKINQFAPSLVLSLHLTPGGSGTGGMAAVLSPGFATMDLVRKIHLGEESLKVWQKTAWQDLILRTRRDAHLTTFEVFRADIWGYFHGYRSQNDGSQLNFSDYRGLRHNLTDWSYRDHNWPDGYDPQKKEYSFSYRDFRPVEQPFWQREKSKYESLRREGGRLGFGGDNHYAANELLHYVKLLGLLDLPGNLRKEKQNKKNDSIGQRQFGEVYKPYVSTYTLPIYTNAIVALLELGSLDIKRDRLLILENQESIARALAIGVYSLYRGLQLRDDLLCTVDRSQKKAGEVRRCQPSGDPLDFAQYTLEQGQSYFEEARPHR